MDQQSPPADAMSGRTALMAAGDTPRAGQSPLSPAQRRLWFLDRYEGGGGVYTIARASRLRGPLDIDALRKAHRILAARHEILRTRYPDHGGVPSQVVDPPGDVDFVVAQMTEQDLDAYLVGEAARGFDLAAGPVWRLRLIALGDDDHVLLTVVHHIAADGWSFPVLRREIGDLYRTALSGTPPDLPDLPAQYRDYAIHQMAQEGTPRFAAALAYWRERMGDDPDPLPLPSDRPRTPRRSASGFWVDATSPVTTEARFRETARELGATPFMLGLALFAAFSCRYARTDDVTIGIPSAERTWPHAEHLIGPFVNSLPIRVSVAGDMTLRELVGQVRRTVLDALDHATVPFDDIVRHVQPRRDASHTPLFQIMYQYRDGSFRSDYALPGIAEELVPVAGSTSKFDLLLEMGGGDLGPLRSSLSASRDLYEEATGRRLLDALLVFADAAVADPDLPLRRTPLAADWETAWLVTERNATARPLPDDDSLAGLFAASVARAPDALAVVDGEVRLTYRELDAAAAAIAANLVAAGIGKGDAVGLQLSRSATLIAAVLAVVRIGAVYVPLDPAYPAARTRDMIDRAGVRAILSPGEARGDVTLTAMDVPTSPLPVDLDPVYVMFTSGSTGIPKGVVVGATAIVRLVCTTDYVRLGAGDVVAHLSNTAFDAATFEIWGPLLNGATIAVVDQDTLLSPHHFAAALRRHGVTTVFVTTAWFNVIAREAPDAFATVRDVLFGGERCDPDAVRRILDAGRPQRLLHVYGPTETTTFASWYEIESVSPDAATVPIGGPIANTTLYVLDAWGVPLPPRLVGELHIGGPGVAIGYLGDPAETRRRFIPDPFGDDPWGRLYATGDLVRFGDDGAMEFVGRVDRQVKLRGFRIEPEDVEHALRRHPAVADAVVRLVDLDGPALAAWALVPNGDAGERELRTHLGSLVPGYMTPVAITPIRELPIDPNGKVDVASLPQPRRHAEGSPVRGDEEANIAAAFERVLGVSGVGRTDSFFDLGGHSISAVELISALEAAFGRRIPVSTLFETPTPAGLAAGLSTGRLGSLEQPLVPMAGGGDRPPLFVFHHPSGTVLAYEPLVRHVGHAGPVYGVQALGVDGTATPHGTIEEMAEEYARLLVDVAPTGPMQLAGHSLGGLLAWETAAKLLDAGREVSLLALLDTKYPYATHQEALRRMGHSPAAAAMHAVYRAMRRVAGDVRWGTRIAWYTARSQALPAELARVRLVRAASRAFERYRPCRLECGVTYFLATGSADADPGEVERRWGGLCTDIEIVCVPGTHTGPDSLLAEPHVAVLAGLLGEQLGGPARTVPRGAGDEIGSGFEPDGEARVAVTPPATEE